MKKQSKVIRLAGMLIALLLASSVIAASAEKIDKESNEALQVFKEAYPALRYSSIRPRATLFFLESSKWELASARKRAKACCELADRRWTITARRPGR